MARASATLSSLRMGPSSWEARATHRAPARYDLRCPAALPRSLEYRGLDIRPYGIKSPRTKTGPNPPDKTSSAGPDSAFFASGGSDPIQALLEHLVTGKPTPGSFDQQVTHATGALMTDMATPNGSPRGILAGCQSRVAEQRPLIGKAGHITQLGRKGPGDYGANARHAPLDFFNLSLCLRLLPQQMAHLDELACGKAPLLG